MIFKEIDKKLTHEFILTKHYAQRLPAISWAFGCYINNKLEGVITIGKPASNHLCKGVCGEEYSSKVFELNRICMNEGLPKNTLSQFVSYALKTLKQHNLILISYADTGMTHVGYIYQATNWLYTGQTKSRTDMYVPRGKHSRHCGKKEDNPYKHLRVVRTSKHRYIYFCGDKTHIKKYKRALKYPILPYPKSETQRYELGTKQPRKIINTDTNEVYYD